MGGFDTETPRPAIVRFLETVAAMIDLRDGRLELVFRGGRLECWLVDGGVRMPADLGAYDGLADTLLQRAADNPWR